MKKHTLLSWSSGKDSAWALYELRQSPDIEVVGLVTTVNQAYECGAGGVAGVPGRRGGAPAPGIADSVSVQSCAI